MYLAKDFIETAEGLVFAVVETGLESNKVLCFLRYVRHRNNWKKVSTTEANDYLALYYPHYLYYSVLKDANLHAVCTSQIHRHHQPRAKLAELISSQSNDMIETDLIALVTLFVSHGLEENDMGVTGSILIQGQTDKSDIDLVFYKREVFHKARKIIQKLIELGDCVELSIQDWLASYNKRDCDCDLCFSEYTWHEKRKYNKAVYNQRKFDINFVLDDFKKENSQQNKKITSIVLETKIIEDDYAFDYPAKFLIDHHTITSIVCYTATYTGQAQKHETIEVSGLLELSAEGEHHIVVGSTREAEGEYIKVIGHAKTS